MDNNKLKRALITDLIKDIPNIEKKVLDSIYKILDGLNTSSGTFTDATLSNTKMLEIQQAIKQTLKNSGYTQQAETFIQDLSKLTINTNLLLDEQGFSFSKLPLSDIEKKWKNLTAETLLGSGIREDFETPILRILDESISYGSSVNAAKEKLQEFVLSGADKNGKLKSYLTVTARDSIGQLQGQQMGQIATANDYAGVLYVGGVLDDTRGQCWRWVKELHGFIPKEKLKEEIKLAYRNQTLKLVENGHKWGGMMPNTDEINFFVKRGGYGCLHTAIPKRKKAGK